MFAPIALFVYKRPEHTRRVLASLVEARGFSDSNLHVFCDGPKSSADAELVDETRRIVSSFRLRNATIICKERNVGLRRSVIAGVSSLCEEQGTAIVLEDDTVIAQGFIEFMNAALVRYGHEAHVLQISGHMFPVRLELQVDAFFMPFCTSWGWATWGRAWSQLDQNVSGHERLTLDDDLRRRFDLDSSYPYARILRKQVRGEVDSWAIQWYWTVFSRNGLVLYPRRSMVRNVGLDGSGTHGRGARSNESGVLAEYSEPFRWPSAEINIEAYGSVKRYLRRESSLFRKALSRGKQQLSRMLGRAR